ncbi:MAG: spore maturation protein [Deltaproteobacteria bacterium]|nr:MAG: spore maturation protein [Deltaproteobacteria bacterium]
MNTVWLILVVGSVVVAAFTGRMEQLTLRSFQSAKEAVELAISLIGIMAFWLGLMKVASEAGLLGMIARTLRRPMKYLFPQVPEDHPAMSAMIMNFAANIMGLANAATPFGIKAMEELDRLNPRKGTATDAMCLFLAINTSSLALIPTGVMGLRAASGSQDPACIWLPTLLATATSTLVGIAAALFFSRLAVFRLSAEASAADALGKEEAEGGETDGGDSAPEDGAGAEAQAAGEGKKGKARLVFALAFVAAMAGAAVYRFAHPSGGQLPTLLEGLKGLFAHWSVPLLIAGFLLFGWVRGVKVYESLVEGAKEGFDVAVKIIPYLVAVLVAVAMFRASGAMELLKNTVGVVTGWMGLPAEALPMALVRPLSGSGAFGYMSSIFNEYGPDSFLGKLVSVMQGSTETTLYVLAVYFGAVRIRRVRHALAAGLVADFAGIVAAVFFSHLFFVWF